MLVLMSGVKANRTHLLVAPCALFATDEDLFWISIGQNFPGARLSKCSRDHLKPPHLQLRWPVYTVGAPLSESPEKHRVRVSEQTSTSTYMPSEMPSPSLLQFL